MPTASAIKLLTTLVALDRLGPAFRAETWLAHSGEIREGVLHGDLVLEGGGAPDFSWQVFREMLQTARERGIREIAGDLVIDRERFQPARIDVGVPPFDESPEFGYNVIPDALHLNGNLLRVNIRAGSQSLGVYMRPGLHGVQIVSQLTLIDRPCGNWEDGWRVPYVRREGDVVEIVLHGEFPRRCERELDLNVLDRALYVDRLFRTLWQELGGRFSGTVREGRAPQPLEPVARHRARSLPEIVRDVNKASDNPLARLLFLQLGASAPADAPSGPTRTRAEWVIREWLRSRGIDDDGLVIDNGSGLSRLERMRPSQMVALLTLAGRMTLAPEFLSSLPLVGTDGTMRLRGREGPAAGKARIKTGTLRDVVAVAGYVPDAKGEIHVLAAFINHPTAERTVARPVLDALIDWVARRP
jgi:D-alanyl-D-alanine carboxypeptidase/D-alanyl-D-alanine-endopeptidase (penicillin-binding protein 4)